MTALDTISSLVARDSTLDPETLRARYADHLRRETLSSNTLRAYRSDFRHFASWCEGAALSSLPADELTVCAYLLHHGHPDSARAAIARPLSPTTLARRLAGIRFHHDINHVPWLPDSFREDDLIRPTLSLIGIEQAYSVRAPTPLSMEKLIASTAALPDSLHGMRNRALILLGFFAALRRSEIAALDITDITFSDGADRRADEGMIVTVRRSKTDRKGRGRAVCVNYSPDRQSCAVRAVRAWMESRGSQPGPLFTNIFGNGAGQSAGITGHSVDRIVKAALAEIGIDPANYAAHSLRSGFATAAARVGVPPSLIQFQLGHASSSTTDRYIRLPRSMRENATSYLLWSRRTGLDYSARDSRVLAESATGGARTERP